MNDSNSLPVLIAGGGIGGCAAALALAKQGFTSLVLEQAAELKEIGAGIQLGPNVFRVLDQLGLRGEIEKFVFYPEALVLRDAVSAEVVTLVPLGAPFLKRFGQPYAVVYRADLHQVLVEACRRDPKIRLTTGQRATSFEERENQVHLRTEHDLFVGSSLVGCDGLWSGVRESIVGDGKPAVSGHIAYRAVLRTSDVPHDLRTDTMTLWAGPKFHLVQYPLRGGELTNLVGVFHSDKYEEGWDTYGDVGELQMRFAAACEPVKRLLAQIETWRMWVLCDRDPISDWSRGRATLLGDAAHPMLQYMAQGACMAMEDAVVLAGRLAQSPDDPAGAFRNYQRARYLRTARVQLTARMYGAAYHAENAVRDLRNDYLRRRTPEEGMESLAWLYDQIQ